MTLTVADLTSRQTLLAKCSHCGHDAPISKARLHPDKPLDRVKLRCRKCDRVDTTNLLIGPQPYRTVIEVFAHREAFRMDSRGLVWRQ